MVQIYLPLIASGLAVGSLYGLVAFGMILLLKATHTFNYAQFQSLTLGAYVAYALMSNQIMPFFPAVIVAGLVGFVTGILTYYLVIRHMQGHSMFAVFAATVGVALVIKAVMGAVWGYQVKSLPITFGQTPIQLGSGIAISSIHVAMLVVALLFIGAFIIFFMKTLLGTQMRAVANDREAANIMGININKVYIVSWGVAIASSAIAGVFLGALNSLNLNLGDIGMKAFPVVILAGMESIPGSIIAGMLIGLVEVLSGFVFGQEYRQPIVYALLLIVLMVKPYGLFGERHTDRV